MKRQLFILLALFCLCGCGPKEPGAGLSAEVPSASPGAMAADNMRLPLTGTSHNERILYYYNRPEMTSIVQRWHREQFRRLNNLKPSDEMPAFEGMERTKSPFRQ